MDSLIQYDQLCELKTKNNSNKPDLLVSKKNSIIENEKKNYNFY